MGHLYRVGDMIPQFTCNGFHGCEYLLVLALALFSVCI